MDVLQALRHDEPAQRIAHSRKEGQNLVQIHLQGLDYAWNTGKEQKRGFPSHTTHETYWVRFQPPGEFSPSEWPRRARLYLKCKISPIIELLIIPVWHSNWPVTRMDFSASYFFQFSVSILTSNTATETCSIHTKLQLLYRQHSTETRGSHHADKTLKLTSDKNGFVCIIYISIFSEHFDQQTGNWKVPHPHQTSTLIWTTFHWNKSFSSRR